MRARTLVDRALLTLGIVALLLGMAIAPRPAAGASIAGRVVALDPGHFETANDTGAVNTIGGATLVERDVNWQVVLATKAKLEETGAIVVLTRNDGEYVDRPTRYKRAADAGAEVLVSVHHNGSSDPSVNYSATFYTQPSDKPVASAALKHLVAQLGFANGGVRKDAFGMTVKPKMPSTLTEAWFITNDVVAARYLNDPSSLIEPESRALADAIAEYLLSAPAKRGR